MKLPYCTGFLGLARKLRDKHTARVTVVPVPFEATTSFGTGTVYGPNAIISASQQVEFWDEQLQKEPCSIGIYTAPPVFARDDWTQTAQCLTQTAYSLAQKEKFPLFLGGEHSISAPIVKGMAKKYKDITVLHLDAHADLRDEYMGLKSSHACVMRRIFDMNIPFCSVAIRSLSHEEHELIIRHKLNILYAHQIREDKNWMEQIIGKLGEHIYITFDIDAVDISEVRATGTPEPGGLLWQDIMSFFEKLSLSGKKVVGADLVELAPQVNDRVSSFYAARLAYKMIAYFA